MPFQGIVLSHAEIVFLNFGEIPQLFEIRACKVNDWYVVIRNEQGHRVCDQDFGPVIFLFPQRIAEEKPMLFFFNEIYNCIVFLIYACGIDKRIKKG